MNLHGIVRGAITSVNPDSPVIYLQSTGDEVDAAGNQTPTYAAAVNERAQIQPLSNTELQHMHSLNMQGKFRKLYCFGEVNAVVRAAAKGGDLFQFSLGPGDPTLRTWLVAQVLEQWPDWVSLVVVLQQ